MTDKPLTEKQEAFALKVSEGSTYSGAYRHAYNAENMTNEVVWVKASELMSNGKVSVRVMELQELAQERTLVTIESLTEELEEAQQMARLDPKGASAFVSAVNAKAKLHGLGADKIDLTSSDGSMSPQPLPWHAMYKKRDDGDS